MFKNLKYILCDFIHVDFEKNWIRIHVAHWFQSL